MSVDQGGELRESETQNLRRKDRGLSQEHRDRIRICSPVWRTGDHGQWRDSPGPEAEGRLCRGTQREFSDEVHTQRELMQVTSNVITDGCFLCANLRTKPITHSARIISSIFLLIL